MAHPRLQAATLARLRAQLARTATRAGWSIRQQFPRTASQTEESAAALEPNELLIAAGGDGFMGRAAAGAIRSGATLVPIPAGRGNDFARALGVPQDPSAAIERLPTLTPRRVDVGVAGSRIFISVACMGVDAVANHLANSNRWLRGGLVYPLSGALAILRHRPADYQLECELPDGSTQRRQVRGWTVAVGCTDRYGGGLRVCPDARPDDGLLTVVTIGAVPRWQFVSVLRAMSTGRHVRLAAVTSQQVRSIRVTATVPLRVFADGDEVGWLPMTVSVQPGALRLLA